MSDKNYYTPKHHQQTPSNSQFKTPLPYTTPRSDIFATPIGGSDKTDSDESTATTNSSSENGELTIVAEFDDLLRCLRHQRCKDVEDAFKEMAEQMNEMQMQWRIAVQECKRLRVVVEQKTQDCSDLEGKLKIARRLLDQEKKHTRRTADEKEQLVIWVF